MISVHGGVKFYRGSPAAARSYVEADRSRADDYYLAEGTGLAERYAAVESSEVTALGPMDGETYETWVAGHDPATLRPRGRLRTDEHGLRFVEVVVNGPKTWSMAAALHPEIAAAYDDAQDQAAAEIIAWLGQHATTRIGPRGRQVQVPVERIEAAVVRHYTSRAGDPHRHLHLQINARVFAAGAWRGLHSVGVVDSIEAINGIGHAAVACHPRFRHVLASHGYTLDAASGEITELTPYAGAFSARAAQIGRNIDRFEATWRQENPGEEPGPRLRQVWDRRAWAQARPDKIVPTDGADLTARWAEELDDLGFAHPPRPVDVGPKVAAHPRPAERLEAQLDPDAAVDLILCRLGARRSAWNSADIRGEAERIIAATDTVTPPQARQELASALSNRTIDRCAPLLVDSSGAPDAAVPEHVRALTSDRVLAIEADLVRRLTTRAATSARPLVGQATGTGERGLDHAQRLVVAAIAGTSPLLVVEGAAGAGKTTTLAAARARLEAHGHRLVVVTPTLKAAKVAQQQVGPDAFSAAWLIHQHGFRWDDDGHWSRTHTETKADPRRQLRPGDVLLVDEAGMLDQDTARALLVIADETHARLALVGDRHQLPAVGRGGVLDHAVHWVDPEAPTGPGTSDGRTRGEPDRDLVIADTREQVAALNAAVRDQRPATGHVDHDARLTTRSGVQLGVGDRITTRRNDPDLGVANRDTWTITSTRADGSLHVRGQTGDRTLPAAYVQHHVELAYATTVHGAQGETVDRAHLVIGETTGAAAAYVGMTRGRHTNTAHLVADNTDAARAQWIAVFSRDRADLGPAHATQTARDDIDRYGPQALPALQAASLGQRAPDRAAGQQSTSPGHSQGRDPTPGTGR